MKLKNHILDFFYKKQKLAEALAIFFLFLGITFKFKSDEAKWFWAEYPYIAFLISGISLTFGLIWLKTEKRKIRFLIDSIYNKQDIKDKINLLTDRQKQVFELILQNKSNKEISKELFIELSTLKTHINKIYKTLDIKNRKEAKKIKQF